MEMIFHLRLLATLCGAFVVVAGSWLAMRESWRWAWSVNTAGVGLLVLLALTPLRVVVPVPVHGPAFVSSAVSDLYHDPHCMFARAIVNPVEFSTEADARRAGKVPCRCVTSRHVAGK